MAAELMPGPAPGNGSGNGSADSGPADAQRHLKLRYLGIDTYQHHVVFVRRDCPICQAQGFTVQSRVQVRVGAKRIIATVNAVHSQLLGHGEASLSEAGWNALDAQAGDEVELSLAPQPGSLTHLRAKAYGHRLDDAAMRDIVGDISAGRYSDLHLASFVTACAGDRLDAGETIGLTRAMIAVGDHLEWKVAKVMDKHCIGGLPGNRTTPIVVAIVAAHGLTIPKTSSRAITSPAGTADTMEQLAPVMLDRATIRRVVEQEGGCVAWGGAAGLSPADDLLVRVERPLELDSEGQMIASILSKKAAAGATHVVIDIPIGPTAKMRSLAAAEFLRDRLIEVGHKVDLQLRVLFTDGTQPVGRGIGPALEAWDILAVLRGEAGAPTDLRARSLDLAGMILEVSQSVPRGLGRQQAELLLESGTAWKKFLAICAAQGGMRQPPRARHMRPITASRAGKVVAVNNRLLSRTARLAGAPQAPSAGIEYLSPLGRMVEKDEPLFIIHAESGGVLQYALDYIAGQSDIVTVLDDA